jgi:hypothetical protein
VEAGVPDHVNVQFSFGAGLYGITVHLAMDRLARWPALQLDSRHHLLITNEFRQLVPYGSSLSSAENLKAILIQVYTTLPIPLTPWKGGW